MVEIWVPTSLDSLGMGADPQGHYDAQAFLATHVAHTPLQILTWFVRRWRMEVPFEQKSCPPSPMRLRSPGVVCGIIAIFQRRVKVVMW